MKCCVKRPTGRLRLRVRAFDRELLRRHGPQGWWPVTRRRGEKPRYHPGREGRRLSDRAAFEIMVGAILTQNTAWKNVELALVNLTKRIPLTPERLARAGPWLEEAIRSSGYYNQKAKRLREFAAHLLAGGGLRACRRLPTSELRRLLLSWRGIGPETADSMLCYALNRPVFVVDAYARRLFARRGLPADDYEEMRALVETALPESDARLGDFHARIVAEGKRMSDLSRRRKRDS